VGGRLNIGVVQRAVLAQACCLLVLAGLLVQGDLSVPVTAERSEVMIRAQELFQVRTDLLREGNLDLLDPYYDQNTIGGSWSLEREQARIKYMGSWLQERNVDLIKAEVMFTRAEEDIGPNEATLSICAHTILTYRHKDYPMAWESTMGWRTVHWLELAKKNGQWAVTAEWFVDPLENASQRPIVAENNANLKARGEKLQTWNLMLAEIEPWRKSAANYGDRYAGVKVGFGVGRYNQGYRDFTGLGGDCANFVSQALADQDGGNLSQDWGWFYENGEGTVAWLKAEALVQHLVGSGRASCLARGTLSQVCASTPAYPSGAIRELLPGDIIAYEEKGEIAHVSLVVGFDPAGYLLVNSHSADRYRVPWDLGYNADVVYWLLQVHG
jgi:hypothetical protein